MFCYKIDIHKPDLVNLLVYLVNLLVYLVNLLVYFVNLLVYFVNLLVYFVSRMYLNSSVCYRVVLIHMVFSVFHGDANRISVLMNNHTFDIYTSFLIYLLYSIF